MQNMQKCFILLDRHAPRQCGLELLQPEGLRRKALPAGVAAATVTAAVAGPAQSGGATGSPWFRKRQRNDLFLLNFCKPRVDRCLSTIVYERTETAQILYNNSTLFSTV
jgi:hypothetical protein